jgi:hypothetical protein
MVEKIDSHIAQSYTRRRLEALKSDGLTSDDVFDLDSLPEQPKAEVYAILGYLFSQTIPHMTAWQKENPEKIFAYTDENGQDTYPNRVPVSYRFAQQQITQQLQFDHALAAMIEGLVREGIDRVVDWSIIDSYAQGDLTKEDLAAATDVERAVLRLNYLLKTGHHRAETLAVRDTAYDLIKPSGTDLTAAVVEGVATAAPHMAKKWLGSTRESDVRAVREACYPLVLSQLAMEFDTNSELQRQSGFSVHSFMSWVENTEVTRDSEGKIRVQFTGEFKEYIQKTKEIMEKRGAEVKIGCPALYAKDENGTVAKYLWDYAMDKLAVLADPVVNYDMKIAKDIRDYNDD